MEEISNEYIIVAEDRKILCCYDINTVKEYLEEYYEEKIRKYCEDDDLDYEDLSRKKRKEIMLHIGYADVDNKVYKIKKIISEIKRSELDEDVKSELLELLIDYGDEFYLDEFDGLKEILDEIEDIDVNFKS